MIATLNASGLAVVAAFVVWGVFLILKANWIANRPVDPLDRIPVLRLPYQLLRSVTFVRCGGILAIVMGVSDLVISYWK